MKADATHQNKRNPVSPRGPLKQELLNELRTEILDYRAVRLNRWLQVVGFVLTFFALAVTVAGFAGFREFSDIKRGAEAARTAAETAKASAQTAQRATDGVLSRVEAAEARVEAAEAKVEAAEAKLRAQTEVLDTVERKVDQLGFPAQPGFDGSMVPDLLAGLGFDSFDTRSGNSASRATVREEFSVPAGRIRFTGECEDGCADLDLALYRPRDDTEDLLDEDVLLDAFPIVEYEAQAPETVVVEIRMVECLQDLPCPWTLTAYVDP